MSVKRRGDRWAARWREPGGIQRYKSFDRKVDAEKHETAMKHSMLTGSYVDPSAGKVTFKSYAEAWRAVQVHRPGTASQIETNLRRHVYPCIGSRPIGAIRKSEIQGLVKAMADGSDTSRPLAAATVRNVYTWVSTIFKCAQQDRAISTSPCHGVRLPEVHLTKVSPLQADVVAVLIDRVAVQYKALLILGAGTGVRISEALGLTNDRVDWLHKTMTIDRQLTGIEGNKPVFGPVKDKKNRPRTIPLPHVVVDALAEHIAREGLGRDGLLFTNGKEAPVRRTTFSDAWRRAASPLGIPLGDGFHQLRHFYASLLIHNGESVKVVQERLGHSSAMETLDTYGHLWPDSEDSTRAAVDRALGGFGRDAIASAEIEGVAADPG